MERHALFDGVVVARDVLDRGVEVVSLRLGEEAHVPEVDAEQRHVHAAGELGASQDRAVTAEDHDEVAPLGHLLLGADVHAGAVLEVQGLRLVGLQGHVDAEVGEALDDALGDRQRLGAPRVGHEQDPARHGAPSRSMAPSMSSTAVTGAPGTGLGASQKRNSRLPSPPAIGLAVAPCRCRPRSATTPATSLSTSRRSCAEVTTPERPSRSRPTSNCGFTSTTRSPSSVTRGRIAGRAIRREMKLRSETTRSNGPPRPETSTSRMLVPGRSRTRGSEAIEWTSW